MASSSRSNITYVERIVHKLKKQAEDWFVYEESVVNCWCDLRATKSIAMRDLEHYFGYPREKEAREAMDDAKRKKNKIIAKKDDQLKRYAHRIRCLKAENYRLTGYVDGLVKNRGFPVNKGPEHK